MMFLQAAGMDADRVRDLEARLDAAEGLDPDERTIVRFTRKATESPGELTRDDVAAFAVAAGDEGRFVEATNVIAAFNFITRIADALGVDLEIPRPIRRFEFFRHATIRVMGGVLGMGMDLSAMEIAAAPQETLLRRLDSLYVDTVGFGLRPGYLDRLTVRPYLLEAQTLMVEAVFTKGVLPLATIVQLAVVVASLTGDRSLLPASTEWLARREIDVQPILRAAEGSVDANLGRRQTLILQFARNETLHAYKTTEEHVQELRSEGLTDEEILDVVTATAAFNASSRLGTILTLAAESERVSEPRHREAVAQ